MSLSLNWAAMKKKKNILPSAGETMEHWNTHTASVSTTTLEYN